MAITRINELPPEASPVATEVMPVDGSTTRKATIQSIVYAGRPTATQAEAEAGTDANKAMTPLTTAQAIAALAASTAQGALANTALQPSDIGTTVATAVEGERAVAAFGPFFNIEDPQYGGAPGEDIAAALTAAAADVPATGGTIVFPRCGYELNSLVEIGGKPIRLLGPGSSAATIKMTSGAAGIVYEGTNSRHLFEVSDMAFGAFAAATGTAIEATWTTTNGNEAQFVGSNVQFRRDADGSFFAIGLRLNNCRNPKISQFQMAGTGPTTTSTMLEIDGVTTDASISDSMTAHVQIPVRVQGASEGVMVVNSAFINCDIGVKADFTTSKPYIALTAVNINARSRCVSAYNVKQLKAAACLFYANTLTVDQPGWDGIYINGEGGANGAQNSSITDCLFFGQSYTGTAKGIVVEDALYIKSAGNMFYDLDAGIEWMADANQCRSEGDYFKFCTSEVSDSGTDNIRTGVSDAASRAFLIGAATAASLILRDNGSTANARAFRLMSDADRLRISALNDDYSQKQVVMDVLDTLVALGGTAGGEALRANVVASAVNRVNVSGAAAGTSPLMQSAGADTNINLRLSGKGTGVIVLETCPSYATNAAAVTGGVPVGGLYFNTTVGAVSRRT